MNTWAIANFFDSATVAFAAPIERLSVRGRKLLRCGGGWAETGANIGTNLMVDAPTSAVIDKTGCPLAAPQEFLSMTPAPTPAPPRVEFRAQRFGPSGRVGLSDDQTFTAAMDIETAFYVPAAACADGMDNDLDGLTDAADPGCDGSADDSEKAAYLPCDDGIDNDGDGAIDRMIDRNGDGISDAPGDVGCFMAARLENPSCQNGVNDDPGQDGLIDFDGGASAGVPLAQRTAPDPQCQLPFDRESSGSGCGLGAELALVLGLLAGVRRRARHRSG